MNGRAFFDTPEAARKPVKKPEPPKDRVAVLEQQVADLKWDVRWAWSMAGAAVAVSIIALLLVTR